MRFVNCLLALALGVGGAWGTARAVDFVAFESGPVRPIALAPSGDRVFLVNTPDNRLEVFDEELPDASLLRARQPSRSRSAWSRSPSRRAAISERHLGGEPPVGQREHRRHQRAPVARASCARCWWATSRRDIVVAGASGNRAFITTAHRGQHRTHSSIAAVPGAGDPQLTTPSVRPRRRLGVRHRREPGQHGFGGTPIEIIELFGDTPRALARSADGTTVYVGRLPLGQQDGCGVRGNGLRRLRPCAANNPVRGRRRHLAERSGGRSTSRAATPGPYHESPAPEDAPVGRASWWCSTTTPVRRVARRGSRRNWSNGIRFFAARPRRVRDRRPHA